jgi:hypothetical protein
MLSTRIGLLKKKHSNRMFQQKHIVSKLYIWMHPQIRKVPLSTQPSNQNSTRPKHPCAIQQPVRELVNLECTGHVIP